MKWRRNPTAARSSDTRTFVRPRRKIDGHADVDPNICPFPRQNGGRRHFRVHRKKDRVDLPRLRRSMEDATAIVQTKQSARKETSVLEPVSIHFCLTTPVDDRKNFGEQSARSDSG